MKKIKVGVIGLGNMGYLHLMNCLHIADVNVVAVADKSKRALKKAESLGVKARAIKKVNNLKVVFATPMNFGLTENLKAKLKEVNIGFLDKKKCINLQNTADVLFLPLAFNSPYAEEIECAFPCKLLEYLVVGKPTLAVVPKGSFVESFINKFEVGVVVTEVSIDRIIEAIEVLKNSEIRKIYSKNALRTVKLFDSKKTIQEINIHTK